jgi:hypothetical protein
MPMIHVARDGAKLGEFTLEQIREGLGTGQFRASDLGWQTGMAEWRPLSSFVAPAEPAAAPGAPVLPLATAAGFSAAAPGTGLPWENREQLGLVKAWFDTVSLLITKPSDAFTIMRPEGGMGGPLLFGMIGGCAGGIVSLLFQGLLQSIPGVGNSEALNAFGVGAWTLIVIYAVLMPVLVAFGLFVGSAVLHLCLMMVGGANRSFETTFRVVCFTCGAANLFSMVPICGGLIAAVYQIVLECIGLSRAHQTTTGKAIMAILLPLIVCCGLITLIIILAGGVGAFGSFLNRH